MHVWPIVGWGFIAILLSGCATFGDESISERPADWPPLTMTRAELMSALGPPRTRAVSTDKDGTKETYVWAYGEAQAHPGLFVPIVGLFVAASGNGVTGSTRALTAIFSPDGKMLSRNWAYGTIGKFSQQETSEETSGASPNRYDPTAVGSQ